MGNEDYYNVAFLKALDECEELFSKLSFKKYSFKDNGITYISYRKDDTIVEFLFGPPEFDVEMIIYVSGAKFAFKELIQIPQILDWMNQKRARAIKDDSVKGYTQQLKASIQYFIELLEFSLPFIEK